MLTPGGAILTAGGAILTAGGVMLTAGGARAQELRRQGEQLYYCDAPVRLVGYGDYGSLSEGDFDYVAFLDQLAQAGLNFTRVWIIHPPTKDLMPWAGPFQAWDLVAWNPAFWTRLDAFVTYAESRGIVVQVSLFDSGHLRVDPKGRRWARSPFNQANNQQGYCATGTEADALDGEPPIWEQVARPLIAKVVGTLNGRSNVIYEAMNEPDDSDGYGSDAFVSAVLDELHTLLNAPEHSGSRVIAVNPSGGSSAQVNNPKVDVLSFHVSRAADAGLFAGYARPTVVTNDGDALSRSTLEGATAATRAARVALVASHAFASGPVGHVHLDILDRDLNCTTWQSFDHDPRASCADPTLVQALGAYALPSPCGLEPATPSVAPGCPVGLEVQVDNGAAGSTSGPSGSYTESNGNFATAPSLQQAVGATYRYLSGSAGDGTQKGQATWTPTLPRAGVYRVTATFRATGARTDHADYEVHSGDGTTTHVAVDQTQGLPSGATSGPVYADLGTYWFAPGTGHVVLYGDDGQSDEADAMIFTLKACADGCAPNCGGKTAGQDDGCGGQCPQHPPLCQVPPPGASTREAYATITTSSGGWSGVSNAEEKGDGVFAHALQAAPGALLSGTSFDVCDPEGVERIEWVKVAVRSKVNYDAGPRAVALQLSAAGLSHTFAHTALAWDELDVSGAKSPWTWNDVQQLKATLQSTPDSALHGQVWVDAFRVTVGVVGCTPNTHRACSGGNAVWVDGCDEPGAVAEVCDDQNPCTLDGCDEGGCTHTPLVSTQCAGGPTPGCTPRATKVCKGTAIFWVDSCGVVAELAETCNDNDACTTDGCDPVSATCTTEPVPTPGCGSCVPFSALGCVAGNNVWLDSCGNVGAVAGSCDDRNACTLDGCDEATGVCSHTPSPSEACAACPPTAGKVCVANALYWVDGCGAQGELIESCDDGDDCTLDRCDGLGLVCTHQALSGEACPVCTPAGGLACVGDALVERDSCGHAARVLSNCSDGDECTLDTCNPTLSVCQSVPSQSEACLACPPQASKQCVGGHVSHVDACGNVGGLAELCEDGDPCTVEACDPSQAKCFHFPSGAPFCAPCQPTTKTACFQGAIVSVDSCGNVAGLISTCQDNDACTTDTCDAASLSCVHAPITGPGCEVCTPESVVECANNVLVSRDSCGGLEGLKASCDDGDPCTVDVCPAGASACVHHPSPALGCLPCVAEWMQACEGNDVRWFDSCGQPGDVALLCDDGEVCTRDTCDAATTLCAHVPEPGCSDCAKDAATACYQGRLVSVDACGALGDTLDTCVDADPCTTDTCDPDTLACAHAPSGAPECLDCIPAVATACAGLNVIYVDSCGNPGAVVTSCDDGDLCTLDTCEPSTALCVHVAGPECVTEEPCLAAATRVCDGANVAWMGACGQPLGLARVCNDQDPCTHDLCDPSAKVCLHNPVGSPDCGDTGATLGECGQSAQLACRGKRRVWIDACGQVVGLAELCDDNDPCTIDRCDDTSLACVSTPDPAETCDGADATESTDGTDAADGSDSADGTDGAQGRDAADGTDGAQGTDAADGAESIDATDSTSGDMSGLSGGDLVTGTVISSSDDDQGCSSGGQGRGAGLAGVLVAMCALLTGWRRLGDS